MVDFIPYLTPRTHGNFYAVRGLIPTYFCLNGNQSFLVIILFILFYHIHSELLGEKIDNLKLENIALKDHGFLWLQQSGSWNKNCRSLF